MRKPRISWTDTQARDQGIDLTSKLWETADWCEKLCYWAYWCTSNVSGHHRSLKQKLPAGYRVPSLQRRAMCRHRLLDVADYNARHIFYRRVSYHALSLCYVCIRCSGVIHTHKATFVQNFVTRLVVTKLQTSVTTSHVYLYTSRLSNTVLKLIS